MTTAPVTASPALAASSSESTFTAPRPLPTSRVERAMLTRPWLRDARVGDSTLGEALVRQPRFTVEGDGPMSQRRLVPQTPAARALLSGEGGAAVEQVLRGALTAYDGLEDRSKLRGVALSTGVDGFAANTLAGDLDATGTRLPVKGAAGDQRDLEASISQSRLAATFALAHNRGWLTLGPLASRTAVDLAREAAAGVQRPGSEVAGSFMAWLLDHEAQHGITPPSYRELVTKQAREMDPDAVAKLTVEEQGKLLRPLNWLEEASASTVAAWPGRREEIGRRSGIPVLPAGPLPHSPLTDEQERAIMMVAMTGEVPASGRAALKELAVQNGFRKVRSDGELAQVGVMVVGRSFEAYQQHVESLGRVLGLAGVDVADQARYGEVRELLQGSKLTFVPGKLAQRIIDAQGLDPKLYEPLRRRLRDLGPNATMDAVPLAQNTERLVDWVRERATAPPAQGGAAAG